MDEKYPPLKYQSRRMCGSHWPTPRFDVAKIFIFFSIHKSNLAIMKITAELHLTSQPNYTLRATYFAAIISITKVSTGSKMDWKLCRIFHLQPLVQAWHFLCNSNRNIIFLHYNISSYSALITSNEFSQCRIVKNTKLCAVKSAEVRFSFTLPNSGINFS